MAAEVSPERAQLFRISVRACVDAWLAACSAAVSEMEAKPTKDGDSHFVHAIAEVLVWASEIFPPLGVVRLLKLVGQGAKSEVVTEIVKPLSRSPRRSISWKLVKDSLGDITAPLIEGFTQREVINEFMNRKEVINNWENRNVDLMKLVWELLVFRVEGDDGNNKKYLLS